MINDDMTNGEKFIKALDKIITEDFKMEPRPDIEPIAIRMRDDSKFRTQMLAFLTILCSICPEILEGLNIISLVLKVKRDISINISEEIKH